MNRQNCEYVVIGGGVSGLATAWYLRKAGREVRLLEKNPAVGGCMRTLRQDGFLLEQGPFNVLVRDPAFEQLLGDLGDDIEVEPAGPDAKMRYLYLGGRLVPLPSGPASLLTSRFLSASGKMRLLAEPICARRPKSDDPTIGEFATRHFGAEFAHNVLGAFVTGVFGGDADRLSLKACFPSLGRLDREYRSLFLHGLSVPIRRIGKPKNPRRRWKGLINFVGGLGAVSDAIARGLGNAVSTNCEVTSVERRGDGYCVAYSASGVSHSLDTRHVVLATPIGQAIDLLKTMADEPADRIAESLATVESVPLVILNLGFRRDDIGHDLKGFGFLVPPKQEGLSFLGVLWASSIFPSHAPPDHHLLRVFVGGAKRPELARKNEDELVALAMDELRDLLELRGDPVLVNSCRHASAVPQYYPGHTEIVRCIRAQLSSVPNLHLVGNYLEGVSINDCVRQAREIVDKMVALPAEAASLSGG